MVCIYQHVLWWTCLAKWTSFFIIDFEKLDMTLTRRECYCVTWVHLSFLCFLFGTNGSLDTILLEKKMFAKRNFGIKAPLSSTRQLHRWSKVTQGSVGISSITPICPSSHLRSGARMCDGDLGEDISRHRDSCLRFSWGDKITCCDRLGSCSHLSLGSLGPSLQLPLSESGQGFLTTCPGWAEGPWHPIFSLMTQQGYCSALIPPASSAPFVEQNWST